MTDEQKAAIYGATSAEWLARWDSDDPVWSIEMGGISPGYEQCIQITAAEILRWMLNNKPDIADEEAWPKVRQQISDEVCATEVIDKLGLTGAQWGVALNLASHLYRRGPIAVFTDDAVKDRHIQVSRKFP